MELSVLAAVRYLTSRKYTDASGVTVTDRRTEADHTEQGHEIWSLLKLQQSLPLSYLFLTNHIKKTVVDFTR